MGVQSKVVSCPAEGFSASFFNLRVPKDFTAVLGDEDKVVVASPNVVTRRSQVLIAIANQGFPPAALGVMPPLCGGARHRLKFMRKRRNLFWGLAQVFRFIPELKLRVFSERA